MHPSLSFSLRDEFSRKPIADKLIHLLTSDIELSPIIINGDWGTGKTEFCHKVIYEIKRNHDNLRCVYVDAFNADSSDEPILTLIAAIISLFPKQQDKKSIIKKAIPVLKYASKVLLNAGTTIILKENVDNLSEELSEALKEQTTTAIDASIDNLLNIHEKSNENILALRGILESLSNEHPIIIFIDELDRCRPNYALKMIESIKHIFNMNNVKFVMISNLKQLESSINKVYGNSIDARKYLDKFISFKIDLPHFHIPNSHTDKLELNSMTYFHNLIQGDQNLNFLSQPGYIQIISFFIKKYRLSLRDIERLVKYLQITQIIGQNLNKSSAFCINVYKIIGTFIYLLNIDLKNKLITEDCSCEDILDLFDIDMANYLDNFRNKTGYSVIDTILITLLAPTKNYLDFEKKYTKEITILKDKWKLAEDGYTQNYSGDDINSFNHIKNTINTLMLI
ncbi:NTPase [Proteus mirabilis]|uniref:KAP family P-loop NTPase fold protein n=1 Tax=Proteus mirabilis TaxID=584 RepID=UPI000D7435CC|nr:P-loop NTPase fold protein [Proteus mirabilis]AWR58131.1 NTPase [Proteus mirabilis]